MKKKKQDVKETHAPASRNPLETGQPLGAEKQEFESWFGEDLSEVRLHTDTEADAKNRSLDAKAFTEGQDIHFSAGAYQPDTLSGKILLAHELAHTRQQKRASEHMEASKGLETSSALEQDANKAVKQGLTMGKGSPDRQAPLSIQRCSRTEQIERPGFFGPHSHETMDMIEMEAETWDLVGDLALGGTLIGLGTSSPEETLASGGYDVTTLAQGLAAIPTIKRARIGMHIDMLFLHHRNDLNNEEQQFWRRIRSNL